MPYIQHIQIPRGKNKPAAYDYRIAALDLHQFVLVPFNSQLIVSHQLARL